MRPRHARSGARALLAPRRAGEQPPSLQHQVGRTAGEKRGTCMSMILILSVDKEIDMDTSLPKYIYTYMSLSI